MIKEILYKIDNRKKDSKRIESLRQKLKEAHSDDNTKKIIKKKNDRWLLKSVEEKIKNNKKITEILKQSSQWVFKKVLTFEGFFLRLRILIDKCKDAVEQIKESKYIQPIESFYKEEEIMQSIMKKKNKKC